MTNDESFDAVSTDTQLLFSHRGSSHDDIPAHLERFADWQKPAPENRPTREIVHYGPENRPRPQRLPRPLPPLPGGDHRLGRGRLAPCGPGAVPELRKGRVVIQPGPLTGYIALRYAVKYLLPVRWSVP